MITGLHSLGDIIFFILPSIIIGYIYGLSVKINLPNSLNLFFLSLIELGLFYISLYLIKFIYNVDMGSTILTLLGSNRENASNILPLLYLTYSYAQIGLASLFINFELPKLKIRNNNREIRFMSELLGLLFLFLSLCLVAINPQISYLLLGLGAYWSIDSLLLIIKRNKWYIYVALGIVFFINLLVFSFAYNKFPSPNESITFSILLVTFPLVGATSKIRKKEETRIK
ncbi:MAG TPA: hypothetical protein DD377_02225 [Firmicutes bacterium]|nr:hypothetical protein [Bacillota bacterium]